MKDTGYFTPDRNILSTAQENGFDPDGDMSLADTLEPLAENDEVYHVEVLGIADGVVVKLESASVGIKTYLEERLEKRSHGNRKRRYQMASGKPRMPRDMEDPHEALEMYADWALENGDVDGIEMEVDWDKLLDRENRGR